MVLALVNALWDIRKAQRNQQGLSGRLYDLEQCEMRKTLMNVQGMALGCKPI